MVKTAELQLSVFHLNIIYYPREALLPYKYKFLCFFSVHIFLHFYLLDFGNIYPGYLKTKIYPWFFYTVCSVSKLELSVHFVNNQSLCVCYVEIHFSGCQLSHSECHVVISHGVSFMCTVYSLQDEIVLSMFTPAPWGSANLKKNMK